MGRGVRGLQTLIFEPAGPLWEALLVDVLTYLLPTARCAFLMRSCSFLLGVFPSVLVFVLFGYCKFGQLEALDAATHDFYYALPLACSSSLVGFLTTALF